MVRQWLFDVPYVKFDPHSWHGEIAKPLIRAKAGHRRLREWPQGKMLHAIRAARRRIAVAVFFATAVLRILPSFIGSGPRAADPLF